MLNAAKCRFLLQACQSSLWILLHIVMQIWGSLNLECCLSSFQRNTSKEKVALDWTGKLRLLLWFCVHASGVMCFKSLALTEISQIASPPYRANVKLLKWPDVNPLNWFVVHCGCYIDVFTVFCALSSSAGQVNGSPCVWLNKKKKKKGCPVYMLSTPLVKVAALLTHITSEPYSLFPLELPNRKWVHMSSTLLIHFWVRVQFTIWRNSKNQKMSFVSKLMICLL